MIDFRYHLVSIVAVFLALAIGIVLGSTALQGDTIDVLRSTNSSQQNELNAMTAQRNSYEQLAGASDTFLQTAEPRLVSGALTGDKIVFVTEPGAPSSITDGIQKAAGYAGASITGTVALQPKFNDLAGANRSSLSALNDQVAATNAATLPPAADQQTVNQQAAASLIATAILNKTSGQVGSTVAESQDVLSAYANNGYLTTSGSPWNRATLMVIVAPQSAPADGPNNPANEVLLAIAGQFAQASAATLLAGPSASSPSSSSAVAVLRGSNVSDQVSSVDNADAVLGQISTIWALADQLAGGKPNSYGISGAAAVSPQPPAPAATPTVTVTPPVKSSTGTGKVKRP